MYDNNLDSKKILKHIKWGIKINNIHIFDEINSTNDYSKEIDGKFNHYDIVVSNSQKNGKGRLGRKFYSPENTGLYLSFSFLINPNSFNFANVTGIAAVAVTKAIEKLTKVKIGIKWVNDLFYNNKKVAGILVEGVSTKSFDASKIIVGVGINLSTCEFPEDIAGIAGSINSDVSRNKLIGYIINYFDYYYKKSTSKYLDVYRSHSIVLGKEIEYYEGEHRCLGKVLEINDYGELVVIDSFGILNVLRTGEISLRVIND